MDMSHTRDQYRYDREKLEALLPAVWDEDFGILAGRAEQIGSSNADPSHGMDLVVMVADVRKAWWSLDKTDHEFLEAHYYYRLSFSAITELAGLEDPQEAADGVERAIDNLIQFLGG